MHFGFMVVVLLHHLLTYSGHLCGHLQDGENKNTNDTNTN